MKRLIFLTVALLIAMATSFCLAESDIRESVVKIFGTVRAPDLARPWSKQNPQEVTGSGVVIDGKRILTNAHVVLYASQIFVQPYQTSDKLPATVEAVAPAMDLAVLKLADESFFDNRPALKMAADLPEVKDTASAYGYPFGGTALSITKGIVSRIELAAYHYGDVGLRIQVDTAINPGNSGGPVLVEDQMVGLVFAHHGQGENIGYIIPNEEIQGFLTDVSDGQYTGKLRMLEYYQSLENESLRAKVGVEKATTGVLVNKPFSDDASYPLKKWDVVTKIGSHAIDNAGIVQIKPNLRLRFEYLVPKLAQNGAVRLSVWRGGQAVDVDVPVVNERKLLLKHLKGSYPSYFIYGPLVFSPGTATYLQAAAGAREIMAARASPLALRRNDDVRFDGEELVIVAGPLFPHKITRGYGNPMTQVVRQVNGVDVKNLRHLVELLRDATDKHVELQFADLGAEVLVFDREEVLAATEEILTDNGIRQQFSADLKDAWAKP